MTPKNKKLILFSEKYDVEEYNRQPLPQDIYNKEGAILAYEGNTLPYDRLLNSYILVDHSFGQKKTYVEKDIREHEESTRTYSEEDLHAMSEDYREDSAEELEEKLYELEFEPIPKVRMALRSNIYHLKEIFETKIVNNLVSLNSENNEKITINIATYLDNILDINMYATDYIDMITAIRSKDNYLTFSHAAAVAFYSLAIAKKLKLLRDDFKDNNLGKWISQRTFNRPRPPGIIALPNSLLQYIDYQKDNIRLKYDKEVTAKLFEDVHDLMYEYATVNMREEYPSLTVEYSNVNRKILTMAALNHDIGKVCIPNKILNKPGKLTEAEFAVMKKHPIYSVTKLKEIGINNKRLLANIIGHHILGVDTGYPKVKGAPPPESKIIAVADIYDAMRSPKYYGREYGQEEALDYIHELYEKELIDLPLYICAIHTFQEYNHVYVKRRYKKSQFQGEEDI